MSKDVPNDPSSADDNPFQPHRKHGANPDEWLNSAAVYVRMSTEHQQYSTSNQMDVLREYAKRMGFKIVKEYFAGKGREIAEKYYWRNSIKCYKWVQRSAAQKKLV